jgi:hypothetical protein
VGRNPYIVAGLSLYNVGAAEIWAALKQGQSEFEQTFGMELEWSINKKGTAAHVQCARHPASPDSTGWDEQHEWLAQMMLRFATIFTDPVKKLIQEYDAGALAVGQPDSSVMMSEREGDKQL